MRIFIVQTCDGYHIDVVSYHANRFSAEWACAHEMHLCLEDDDKFEADKYQIVERELEW